MRLRTLGKMTLEHAEFTRPKPLLLLAYLTLEGKQERRHVAEFFWPGAADRMKSLTVALTRLRKGSCPSTSSVISPSRRGARAASCRR